MNTINPQSYPVGSPPKPPHWNSCSSSVRDPHAQDRLGRTGRIVRHVGIARVDRAIHERKIRGQWVPDIGQARRCPRTWRSFEDRSNNAFKFDHDRLTPYSGEGPPQFCGDPINGKEAEARPA